ncbi:MAG: hypothetical protein NVS3B2_08540 [Ramlibacter sp.]
MPAEAPGDVVACHLELAATLAQMLELARARRWAQLPAFDLQCVAIVGRLRELDAGELSMTQQERVRTLADRIRRGQEELRTLVRPQFVQLMRRVGELHGARDKIAG